MPPSGHDLTDSGELHQPNFMIDTSAASSYTCAHPPTRTRHISDGVFG